MFNLVIIGVPHMLKQVHFFPPRNSLQDVMSEEYIFMNSIILLLFINASYCVRQTQWYCSFFSSHYFLQSRNIKD